MDIKQDASIFWRRNRFVATMTVKELPMKLGSTSQEKLAEFQ